jgi:hypothetical protein
MDALSLLNPRGCYSEWLRKEKKDGARTKWMHASNSRYFTIDFQNQILFYAINETSKQVSMPICFQDILGANMCGAASNEAEAHARNGMRRSVSTGSLGGSSFGGGPAVFELHTRERRIRLSADREAGAHRWVELLSAAKKAGGGAGRAAGQRGAGLPRRQDCSPRQRSSERVPGWTTPSEASQRSTATGGTTSPAVSDGEPSPRSGPAAAALAGSTVEALDDPLARLEDALKGPLEVLERGSRNMDATSNIEAEASAAAAPPGAGGPKQLQAADFGLEEHEEDAILERELGVEKAHRIMEKDRRRAEAEAWACHTAAVLSAGNPKLAGRISADLLLVRDCMPMDAASFWTDDSNPSKRFPIGVAAPVADTDSASDEIALALEKEMRRARKEARRAQKEAADQTQEEAAAATVAFADEDAAVAEASDPAAAADEKQQERERRQARREARRAEREAAAKTMAENEERRLRKEQRRAERERRHAEKGGAAEDAPLETPQEDREPALAAAAMTAAAEARIQADLALVKRQQGHIAV